MGVVKSLAVNNVINFGEIKEINLLVNIINLGIFNDCVCLEVFFVISINFQARYDIIIFLVNLEKHKSRVFYKVFIGINIKGRNLIEFKLTINYKIS